MSTHPDVLILGGGVIGLTCAYFLAREGVRVQIVDKGDFGQEASWAGAGVLITADPTHANSPFDRLRAEGVGRYPSLSAELRERTGIDNGYRLCGGLEIMPAPDEAEHEWRGEGVSCEFVDDRGLRRIEPALSAAVKQAYLLPEMAQIRNPRHLQALQSVCAQLGVGLRPCCPVHGFERRGDRVTAARTGGGTLSADRFLVTAGAWSDALLEPVGVRLGVHPVRGQIALLGTGAPRFQRIVCQGKRYLVPRADGHVLVGSTEENAGFDKRPTAGAIADLLRFAVTLIPSLADAPVERCWAGLRPSSPDGLPYLGGVPGLSNLFVATGHFRSGIQLSPITAVLMKEMLLGQPTSLPLDPFRLDR
jgi:glycine oxidase